MPGSSIRVFHSGGSFYTLMNGSIRIGMSVAEVEEMLGPGELLSGEARDQQLDWTSRFAARRPHTFPDGAQPGDQFIVYPLRGGATQHLQFREGRLINHLPEHFAEYYGRQVGLTK